MNPADLRTSLLEAPRHYGPAPPGALTGAAGSVARACAVQFAAVAGADGLKDIRYLVFGGPDAIAACEYVARQALETTDIGSAQDWLEALALSRDALSTLLVVEDAWRTLVAAATS
ncbi:MAG: hypothetical protein AAF545_01015 [Pseudomonadota bacterium]